MIAERDLARKLDIIRSHPYHGLAKHAEILRRFFVATAGDLNVILTALSLRLNELREGKINTSGGLETLEIYAPIANRLGMGKLKAELETLAFPLAYPKDYLEVSKLLRGRKESAQKRLEQIYRSLRKYFAKVRVSIISSDYRLKNTYSLYKKLKRPEINMDINKINDLLALRLVTDTTENCYRIIGLIHAKYKPVAGKVKDYIANPKPNGYRSLHTTIYTGDLSESETEMGTAEIQVRTREMHDEAEYGVTSHVAYDEGGKERTGGKWTTKLAWVRELVELARKKKSTEEFAEAVKLDYFKDRIFVFTPIGDVVELPDGSTPIDFAYAIHSDLGNRAHAVKINGKYKALDTPLHAFETVEIEPSKSAHPNQKWLEFAKTTEARRKIKSALNQKARS